MDKQEMWHINGKGDVKRCYAKEGNCPFEHHFDNMKDAFDFAEDKFLKGRFDKDYIKYSFLKDWERVEREYNVEFGDIPDSFYNTDLDSMDYDPENKIYPYRSNGNFIRNSLDYFSRLTQIVTKPSESSNLTQEQIKDILEDMGVEVLGMEDMEKEGRDTFSSTQEKFKSPYFYMVRLNIDGNELPFFIVHNTNVRKRILGYRIPNWETQGVYGRKNERDQFPLIKDGDRSIYIVGMRDLLAQKRISYLTGENFTPSLHPKTNDWSMKKFSQELLPKLKEKQLSGSNFVQQKKYIKEQNKTSVATAYQDKKNQDPIHIERGKQSSMMDRFRYIEIDNDVDLNEFAEFEKDYDGIKSILPIIKANEKPELRIRYLGKHRATGIFFPHKNTLCVDVRDSGSFCHEYAHHFDLVTLKNKSLSMDFSRILNQYKRAYSGNKPDYHKTPTEVFARGFEYYLYNKKGVRNRLLKPNFAKDSSAYAPFASAESDLYNFFDKLLGGND